MPPRNQTDPLYRLAASLDSLLDSFEKECERRDKFERAILDSLHDKHRDLIDALRDLPDSILATIEKTVYELRNARWDAHRAGAPSGLPLPPAPMNDSQPHRDETRPFMLTHNDASYVKASGLWEVAAKLWPAILAIGAGVAAYLGSHAAR